MPNIDEPMSKYFVQSGDANPPSEPVPTTFANSKVTPLIDNSEYIHALKRAFDTVGTGPTPESNRNHFILIANWWLGLSGGQYVPPPGHFSSQGPNVDLTINEDMINSIPYQLDTPPGSARLLDVLGQKAQQGVDIRVMGWISFAVMDSSIAQLSGAGSIASLNALTMQSIKDLRSDPAIGNKAILNIVSHTAGAVHAKLVVVGNETEAFGFTGGLDFVSDRWAHPHHPEGETWHDVQVMVEGPAVQGFYDWFKHVWHENISRAPMRFKFGDEEMPHFLPGTPVLPSRSLPETAKGKHHVQNLRTIPRFNYKFFNCMPENPPFSRAPEGIFEFKVALHKAIQNAKTYIYYEDQAFWSQEILTWVRDAIVREPQLRVILVTSGLPDPNDPEFPERQIRSQSINHGLLEGLTPMQRDQVRMYKRFGDTLDRGPLQITTVTNLGATSRVENEITLEEGLSENEFAKARVWLKFGDDHFLIVGNEAVPENGGPLIFIVKNLPGPKIPPDNTTAILAVTQGITVHTKSVLVDDHWAVIGSANCMRRSLYTDFEHSVSFLDEKDILVKEYRKKLWADAFGHGNPDDFDEITAALHGWESTWGAPGAAPSRRTANTKKPFMSQVPLPISPELPLEGAEKSRYDDYLDADARDAWGMIIP